MILIPDPVAAVIRRASHAYWQHGKHNIQTDGHATPIGQPSGTRRLTALASRSRNLNARTTGARKLITRAIGVLGLCTLMDADPISPRWPWRRMST